MARFGSIIGGFCGLLAIGACGDAPICALWDDSCTATTEDLSPVTQAIIHTDGADAIFFEATLTDGKTWTVSGLKDADGLPIAGAEMTVVSADGSEATQYLFDDSERLTAMVTDEAMFSIDYIDDSLVTMTAIELATGAEERVNFTLGQDQPAAQSTSQQPPSQGAQLYGSVSETVVNLTRCGGAPNDDGCPVTLGGRIDGKAFKAVPRCGGLGTGTYPFPMPGAPSSVSSSFLCGTGAFFGRKLVLGAALFKPGCALFIETGIGVFACVAALNGVESLADYFGANPVADASNAWLCGKVSGTVEWGGDFEPGVTSYSLTTTAKYDHEFASKTVSGTLAADGRWPDIDIDFTEGSNRLVVEPGDPIPGESYVAYAHLECIPPNATVVLNVVGDDGYSNSTTSTLSGEGSLSLSVPGGGASVIDKLTATVNGSIVADATIVF
jgi:hypothetical protein